MTTFQSPTSKKQDPSQTTNDTVSTQPTNDTVSNQEAQLGGIINSLASMLAQPNTTTTVKKRIRTVGGVSEEEVRARTNAAREEGKKAGSEQTKADMTKFVANISAQLKKTQAQVTTLTDANAAFETQLSEYADKLEKQQKEFAKIIEEKENAARIASEKQTEESNRTKSDIDDLTDKLNKALIAIKTLTTQNKDLSNQVSLATTKASGAETALEQLVALRLELLEAKNNAAKAEFKVTTLASSVTEQEQLANQRDVEKDNAYNQNLEIFKSQIATLKANELSNTQEINALKATDLSRVAELSTKDIQIAKLESTIKERDLENATKDEAIKRAAEENKTLIAEIAKLQSGSSLMSEQANAITILQTKNTSLEETVARQSSLIDNQIKQIQDTLPLIQERIELGNKAITLCADYGISEEDINYNSPQRNTDGTPAKSPNTAERMADLAKQFGINMDMDMDMGDIYGTGSPTAAVATNLDFGGDDAGSPIKYEDNASFASKHKSKSNNGGFSANLNTTGFGKNA